MGKINKLRDKTAVKLPGKRPGPPLVRNEGLEQALAEAGGNLHELARRLDMDPSSLVEARRKGPSPRLALIIWERCRVKLSKVLGRSVRCPHCFKEI